MARPSEHDSATRPLPPEEAQHLAEAISTFGAASRLRLLWALIEKERTVEELTDATGMTQSATSQQLRVLRDARLVKVRRDGRHAFYSLYDHHVPDLLSAMRHHYEHVEVGDSAPNVKGSRTR
jgi:DNA-binding transcriptional ArsR family regulator